jgi:phage-related protein
MDSIFFSYDGVTSESMGVYLVKLSGGMQPTPFLSEQEIISEKVFGNDTSYVYGTNKSPLKVKLVLASMDANFWTFEKRREIARWLSSNKFSEFYVADEGPLDRRFFLMREGGVDLTTNGVQEGYIEIGFRNISPYTYSGIYDRQYDFSTINTVTNFTFENLGDLDLYPPYMKIVKVGNGDISIINTSDGGREFKFTGLVDGEVLTIDNENRRVDTSLNGTFRYDNFNRNYLCFKYGYNYMTITGKCTIELKWRYSFLG